MKRRCVSALLLLGLLNTAWAENVANSALNAGAKAELNPHCQSQTDAGPEMVLIAAGSFQMGSLDSEAGRDGDESPRHQVMISQPFMLSRCEVTKGDFQRFVTATGYQTQAETMGGCYGWDAKAKHGQQNPQLNWQTPGFAPYDDQHPVVCVNWYDAKAYIDWLNRSLPLPAHPYRLPTEAEWEYAARAASQTPYYWGETEPCAYTNGPDKTLKDTGLFPDDWQYFACADGYLHTAPVGQKQPNVWGLFDMSGNVWEWVEDCWHANYQGAPADGSAWQAKDCTQRSLRGGAWDFRQSGLRSGNRKWIWPDDSLNDVGFRLARTF